MCHKNRGPRCTSCQKSGPRHHCRCPAKYASTLTATTSHDDLPAYAAMIDPQPGTSTLFPISVQSRCRSHGYRGCGYGKRKCRGPIRLLVGMVIRKVQERKERERVAASLNDETVGEVQERGVVETVDEKQTEEECVKREEKNKDVKVLTMSVRSLSL